ncbi:hypothetical protein [Conexibacter sp. S30A1]|uniref:hypothetical protein n=1 Tax=Conexibacter sp. S30A1 TaxID=2937800 RepID=UPI00200EE684|nr:hypothetical protein [Conexibacter sp. S30A1]
MHQPDSFDRAVALVVRRSDRTPTADAAKSLLFGIGSLRTAGVMFRAANYQVAYNAQPLETLQALITSAESVYQHTHSLSEGVAHLIATTANPPLPTGGLQVVVETAEKTNHPIAPALRARRRELQLLKWLGTVRNKAIQHRAENGYIDNNAMVARDVFVLFRKPTEPPLALAKKTRSCLTGLIKTFSIPLDPGTGSRESVAYLDAVSHGLLQAHPNRADPARRIVEEAAQHDVLMSAAALDNIGWALASLIEVVPEHP